MTIEVPLGGEPQQVAVVAVGDWKAKAADWLFKQGAMVVVLATWLGWQILDGQVKDRARKEEAAVRSEFEEKLWGKISLRLEQMSEGYTKALEKAIEANDRKNQRDEARFDKIVDRIKGN